MNSACVFAQVVHLVRHFLQLGGLLAKTLFQHGKTPRYGLDPLEQLHRFLLQLGDALGVTGALLGQKRNLTRPFLNLLGQGADLIANAHDQFREAIVLHRTHFRHFLQPADARKLLANLADLATQRLSISQTRLLQLTLTMRAALFRALHQGR